MVKRVLMLAFHFPPQRGSSGIQRTLSFVRHLPQLGWQPLVLSAHPRAHPQRDDTSLAQLPTQLVLRHAFALDTARHLAWRGRYAGVMAVPDRWVSWLLGAVPGGLGLIRRYRPQVIWSTYPIATAHLAALVLQRLTGLPWIADLRDPMIDASHPSGRVKRAVVRWIEARTLERCTYAVCTTPGALQAYRERYPTLPHGRLRLIENGFEEQAFAATPARPAPDGVFTLLHSGIVYPSERDPRALFAALKALHAEGMLDAGNFRLVLRAAVHETWLAALAEEHGIAGLVDIAPALPYREALAEMLGASGLLLLQAANCNAQIPAKFYEYLRARRPLLALTDLQGDTADAMRAAGIDTIAPLDDAAAIAHALRRFLALARSAQAPLAPAATVAAHERGARAVQFAALLDAVVADSACGAARHDPNSPKAP